MVRIIAKNNGFKIVTKFLFFLPEDHGIVGYVTGLIDWIVFHCYSIYDVLVSCTHTRGWCVHAPEPILIMINAPYLFAFSIFDYRLYIEIFAPLYRLPSTLSPPSPSRLGNFFFMILWFFSLLIPAFSVLVSRYSMIQYPNERTERKFFLYAKKIGLNRRKRMLAHNLNQALVYYVRT